MNYTAASSTPAKTGFLARARALLAEAWRVHVETWAIIAEAQRRQR